MKNLIFIVSYCYYYYIVIIIIIIIIYFIPLYNFFDKTFIVNLFCQEISRFQESRFLWQLIDLFISYLLHCTPTLFLCYFSIILPYARVCCQ
jgi:hypothetical protein